MLREKSCGVVPFREEDGEIRYLVISSAVTKREHWEFPKGGVEEGEREVETALRELREETGVSDVDLLPGYREPIRYIYRRAEGLIFKQVVYFLGRVNDPTITPRVEEVKDYRWATFEEARTLLRHGNARELLLRSHAFITGQPLPPRSPTRKKRPPRRPSSPPPKNAHSERPAAMTGAEAPPPADRPSADRGSPDHAPAVPPTPRAGLAAPDDTPSRRRRRRRRGRRRPKSPSSG